MDLVIKMDKKKTYKICISRKENLMDTILNEIDQLRYAKNIQNPIVELCFQGFKLNAKEIYSLFDELVVHKEIVIANISFEIGSNNEDKMISSKTIIATTILGDIPKDMIVVTNGDIYVMGSIKGTIILKNEEACVYAKEVEHGNILVNNQFLDLESSKDYLCKIK